MKNLIGKGSAALIFAFAGCVPAVAVESLDVGASPESATRGFDGKLFVTLMAKSG